MLLVNNHRIEEETIETEFKRLMRVCLERMPREEAQKQIPAFRLQARDHAINRRLLLDEAMLRNIAVTDKEIDFFLSQASPAVDKENNAGNQHGEQVPGQEQIRERVRDACMVDKLIKSVILSVPEPSDDEALKYLRESGLLPAGDSHDPELMQKLIDKTRQLVKNLRQNQALTDFITGLRNNATITEL
jgi:hypothetical protein